jgi:hypothetical protein
MYQNADKLLQLDQICNLLNMALSQTSSSQMICDLTVQRRGILGSQNAMNAVDGATIERRIRINRPDYENTRCKVSRAWDPRKDFSQPTRPPRTHSTSNYCSAAYIELFSGACATRFEAEEIQAQSKRKRLVLIAALLALWPWARFSPQIMRGIMRAVGAIMRSPNMDRRF